MHTHMTVYNSWGPRRAKKIRSSGGIQFYI